MELKTCWKCGKQIPAYVKTCSECGTFIQFAEEARDSVSHTAESTNLLRACAACGKEISRFAVMCPDCGHPNAEPMWQKLLVFWLKISLIAAALGVLGAIIWLIAI
jgi:RNA polymerase subunit RPABC4/transcription elongation factor Spt4